jgi:hypothetical protein
MTCHNRESAIIIDSPCLQTALHEIKMKKISHTQHGKKERKKERKKGEVKNKEMKNIKT